MIGQREQPAIDLSRNHGGPRPWKDLVIYFTWLWNGDQEDMEPCMVIIPAARRRFRPAVVALSAVYKYNDAKYCVRAAMIFNTDLGFEDNMQNVHKVAEAIHSHLRDLIVMPENPTIKQVNADARVSIGNKTTSVELIDHVSMPQA